MHIFSRKIQKNGEKSGDVKNVRHVAKSSLRRVVKKTLMCFSDRGQSKNVSSMYTRKGWLAGVLGVGGGTGIALGGNQSWFRKTFVYVCVFAFVFVFVCVRHVVPCHVGRSRVMWCYGMTSCIVIYLML